MLVRKFLKEDPASAREGKSVAETRGLMEENNFRIIFVVDEEDKLVGFLTYDSIKDQPGEKTIDSYLSRSTLHAEETDSIDKAVSIIKEYSLMVLPVVDSERRLVGVLTPRKLFEEFSKLLNFGQGGFWITLPCHELDDLENVVSVLSDQNVELHSLLSAGEPDDPKVVVRVGKVKDGEALKKSLEEVV